MDGKLMPAEIEAELTAKERADIEELDMRDVGQVSQGIYRIAKALALSRRRLRGCEAKSEQRRATLEAICSFVGEQTNDEALWLSETSIEAAYIQQALRKLHEVIEGKTSRECALAAIKKAPGKEA